MFRETSTLVFLLAASLPVALCQSTTFPAFFAPPRVAASVVTVGPSATTYALQCTSSCDGIEKGQGTIVNGPATAGLTQTWTDTDASHKTLIYDCAVSSSSVGNCVVKAVKDGATGTGSFTKTTTFKQGDLVVTGGLEQLGIAIATTTTEVNTTVTHQKTTKAPTPSSTLSTSSNITSFSGVSNSTTSTGSKTTSVATTTVLSTSATLVAASTSSAAAAATMKAERVGGAIIGLAGLLLAAL